MEPAQLAAAEPAGDRRVLGHELVRGLAVLRSRAAGRDLCGDHEPSVETGQDHRALGERLQRLYAEGTVILPGPTLGRTITGIAVIEAPDEARDQSAARLWWTA